MKTLNEIIRENNEFVREHSSWNADFHGRMTERELPQCENVTIDELKMSPCGAPCEVAVY